ncbi:hypothetical protein R2R35_14160 [Anaerocolumna sp. AGMB13020]|uniref:phage major capsid protein n=1 Tax=Anaerocolumna sp. AGMB13020 TaxID=3081750 RepID=UPI00295496B7|nr:hypothetical protein [Anaerocolumna sp. AGMB13020]WOO34941.1 hypothetical protein R2R35_14160 [Anaerocolumna sp. AGMB13020]
MTRKQMIDARALKQQELINKAKNEGCRELTSEEQREFDKLQGEIDLLKSAEEGEEPTGDGEEPDPTRTLEAERVRTAEIMDLCRDFGIDPTKHIKDGTSVDGVRAAVLEEVKKGGTPISVRVTNDEGDKYRAAAVDGILMRGGIQLEKPADGARDFRGMSLRDLAIESLERDGINARRMGNDDLFHELMQRQYFNPTSAFPSIMDAAINKAYVEGHKKVNVTFDKWTKKGTLKDFKTTENNYLAGTAGEFLEVPESGELKHDKPIDAKLPTRKLKTYGRQFTMTRQAFINDDIGFLTTMPSRYAASARKTINTQVYKIVNDNPTIYDGIQLFHSAHNNLMGEASGVTGAVIQKMITRLQKQKNQFGEAIIIRPAYVIVPVGYGFTIQTILGSPYIHTGENTQAVNPLYGYKIEVVEDPTLNALVGEGKPMPWYIAGDKNDVDTIQVDYLNGNEIPTIRRMEAPGVLGFTWDIYLDWGISVMDYRGIIKNSGIIIPD